MRSVPDQPIVTPGGGRILPNGTEILHLHGSAFQVGQSKTGRTIHALCASFRGVAHQKTVL